MGEVEAVGIEVGLKFSNLLKLFFALKVLVVGLKQLNGAASPNIRQTGSGDYSGLLSEGSSKLPVAGATGLGVVCG